MSLSLSDDEWGDEGWGDDISVDDAALDISTDAPGTTGKAARKSAGSESRSVSAAVLRPSAEPGSFQQQQQHRQQNSTAKTGVDAGAWSDWDDDDDWIADIETSISKSKRAKPVVRGGYRPRDLVLRKREEADKLRKMKRSRISPDKKKLGSSGLESVRRVPRSRDMVPATADHGHAAASENALRAFDAILDGGQNTRPRSRGMITTLLIFVVTILLIGGYILYINYMANTPIVRRANAFEKVSLGNTLSDHDTANIHVAANSRLGAGALEEKALKGASVDSGLNSALNQDLYNMNEIKPKTPLLSSLAGDESGERSNDVLASREALQKGAQLPAELPQPPKMPVPPHEPPQTEEHHGLQVGQPGQLLTPQEAQHETSQMLEEEGGGKKEVGQSEEEGVQQQQQQNQDGLKEMLLSEESTRKEQPHPHNGESTKTEKLSSVWDDIVVEKQHDPRNSLQPVGNEKPVGDDIADLISDRDQTPGNDRVTGNNPEENSNMPRKSANVLRELGKNNADILTESLATNTNNDVSNIAQDNVAHGLTKESSQDRERKNAHSGHVAHNTADSEYDGDASEETDLSAAPISKASELVLSTMKEAKEGDAGEDPGKELNGHKEQTAKNSQLGTREDSDNNVAMKGTDSRKDTESARTGYEEAQEDRNGDQIDLQIPAKSSQTDDLRRKGGVHKSPATSEDNSENLTEDSKEHQTEEPIKDSARDSTADATIAPIVSGSVHTENIDDGGDDAVEEEDHDEDHDEEQEQKEELEQEQANLDVAKARTSGEIFDRVKNTRNELIENIKADPLEDIHEEFDRTVNNAGVGEDANTTPSIANIDYKKLPTNSDEDSRGSHGDMKDNQTGKGGSVSGDSGGAVAATKGDGDLIGASIIKEEGEVSVLLPEQRGDDLARARTISETASERTNGGMVDKNEERRRSHEIANTLPVADAKDVVVNLRVSKEDKVSTQPSDAREVVMNKSKEKSDASDAVSEVSDILENHSAAEDIVIHKKADPSKYASKSTEILRNRDISLSDVNEAKTNNKGEEEEEEEEEKEEGETQHVAQTSSTRLSARAREPNTALDSSSETRYGDNMSSEIGAEQKNNKNSVSNTKPVAEQSRLPVVQTFSTSPNLPLTSLEKEHDVSGETNIDHSSGTRHGDNMSSENNEKQKSNNKNSVAESNAKQVEERPRLPFIQTSRGSSSESSSVDTTSVSSMPMAKYGAADKGNI